jgi:hypothetical protein
MYGYGIYKKSNYTYVAYPKYGDNMNEKKKILYNTIFDMYKIFVGYCVVFLGATILQTSSGSINTDMGITLIVIDLIAMLIISWLLVPVLYSMYIKL